jgi:hypothetical protein
MQRLFPARASSMFASFLEKRRVKDAQPVAKASKTV